MKLDGINYVLVMMSDSVLEIARGLMEGLSSFCGPTRVAVVSTLPETHHLWVCDEHELLSSQREAISSYYLDGFEWTKGMPQFTGTHCQHAFYKNTKVPTIPGLLSGAMSSERIRYQAWFTELTSPNLSKGPIYEWVDHACQMLSYETFTWVLGSNRPYGVTRKAVANYELDAISAYINHLLFDVSGQNSRLPIRDILRSVSGISTTLEEGSRASGKVLIAEPPALAKMSFALRFEKDKSARLGNWKHVGKLLTTVSGTSMRLVSDGTRLVGVCDDTSVGGCIEVIFRGGRGDIAANGSHVCTFRDGRFSAVPLAPNMTRVHEILTSKGLDGSTADHLVSIIGELTQAAIDRRHGCSILVNLADNYCDLPGERLFEPLDLSDSQCMSLAKGMLKIDGAVQVDSKGFVHAFACLLDGSSSSGEDRSRGARFNSALRFSESREACIVVVVSEDGPISILHHGDQVNRPPQPLTIPTEGLPRLATIKEWGRGQLVTHDDLISMMLAEKEDPI